MREWGKDTAAQKPVLEMGLMTTLEQNAVKPNGWQKNHKVNKE